MDPSSYQLRRSQLEEYFDRTAAETWAKLTGGGPVGRIRATVREGRDRMRALLLSYLPDDLSGQRLLDAGCGTGALAVEAARRGADVIAIDISPTLVALARERLELAPGRGRVTFAVSDMLDPSLGTFDWVVAMDSLIHYEPADMAQMVANLAGRARRGMAFTFAPRTTLLSIMHLAGQAFPRGHRSPAIVPIAERSLRRRLEAAGLRPGRSERVDCGFYISQALELTR